MAHTSLVYRGCVVDESNSSIYTFPNLDVGAPNEFRVLVVIAAYTGLTSTSNSFTVSLDANDTFMTRQVNTNYNGNHGIAAFYQPLPIGTEITATVTVGTLCARLAMAWYTIKPASSIPVSSNYDYNYGTGGSLLNYMSSPEDGGLAIFAQMGTTSPTFTFSGDGTPVRDVDNLQIEGSTSYFNVAHVLLTGSNTAGGTYSGTAGPRAAVAIGFGQQIQLPMNVIDGFSMVDDGSDGQLTYNIAASNTLELYDFANYNIPQLLSDTQSEAIGVADFSRVYTQLVSLSDTILSRDQYSRLQYGDSSDIVSIVEQPVVGIPVAASENIANTDVVGYDYRLGPALSEGTILSDPVSTRFKAVPIMLERGTFRDAAIIVVPVAMAEGAIISYAQSVARAYKLIDQLNLYETVLAPTKFTYTETTSVRISDALRRFFGGDAVEGILVSETLSRMARRTPQVSENVGVSESVAKQLILRVTALEDIELTHTSALKMLFRPVLDDVVELAAMYLSPNNSITTWAINTKTVAATEYTNYEFNSLTQMGRKYIAASNTGLYELDGNTDNGAAIIADIKSGLMQLGGSRFSSFKAAYIGMRGSGEFVLKVDTGDGKQYIYKVVGKDMQSSRVHFGKGLRARYFSFELVSTGQDFDIDSVEFIPLVAQRRV